jgi:hypothetical protein
MPPMPPPPPPAGSAPQHTSVERVACMCT